MANTRVKRVLVDTGSSADIITLKYLRKLKYSKTDVILLDQPLIGLSIDFLLVDIPLPYNIIMGRPTLNKAKAAISTYQLLVQFETNDDKVGKIQGDQQAARECYVNSLENKVDVQEDSKKRKREKGRPSSDLGEDQPSIGLGVYITENPKQYECPQPAEEDKEVAIGKKPGRTVRVSKAMDLQTREEII